MGEHHRRAIEPLLAKLEKRLGSLAVLLTGSISRGTELAHSDIDLTPILRDWES